MEAKIIYGVELDTLGSVSVGMLDPLAACVSTIVSKLGRHGRYLKVRCVRKARPVGP